jgi:hypothetical protein
MFQRATGLDSLILDIDSCVPVSATSISICFTMIGVTLLRALPDICLPPSAILPSFPEMSQTIADVPQQRPACISWPLVTCCDLCLRAAMPPGDNSPLEDRSEVYVLTHYTSHPYITARRQEILGYSNVSCEPGAICCIFIEIYVYMAPNFIA